MRTYLRRLVLAVILLTGAWLHGAERMPPAPAQYFNDYTGTVSGPTASSLNRQLEQYERQSSNQLLVVIYPKLESDSSVEDYTIRVAQSWKVGQQDKKNGAVLFVFKEDRQLYIQVGYGLEPTLTDATCHDIIENVLKPRFRQGNFDQGLSEAVGFMIAATQGEYRGTGRTHSEARSSHNDSLIRFIFIGIAILFIVINAARRFRNPSIFMNPSRRSTTWWDIGGGSGGGRWGGGGGGGGFSGGGGSFGGGGAGGKW